MGLIYPGGRWLLEIYDSVNNSISEMNRVGTGCIYWFIHVIINRNEVTWRWGSIHFQVFIPGLRQKSCTTSWLLDVVHVVCLYSWLDIGINHFVMSEFISVRSIHFWPCWQTVLHNGPCIMSVFMAGHWQKSFWGYIMHVPISGLIRQKSSWVDTLYTGVESSLELWSKSSREHA
jgi:hypothetical protein